MSSCGFIPKEDSECGCSVIDFDICLFAGAWGDILIKAQPLEKEPVKQKNPLSELSSCDFIPKEDSECGCSVIDFEVICVVKSESHRVRYFRVTSSQLFAEARQYAVSYSFLRQHVCLLTEIQSGFSRTQSVHAPSLILSRHTRNMPRPSLSCSQPSKEFRRSPLRLFRSRRYSSRKPLPQPHGCHSQ